MGNIAWPAPDQDGYYICQEAEVSGQSVRVATQMDCTHGTAKTLVSISGDDWVEVVETERWALTKETRPGHVFDDDPFMLRRKE